MKPKNTVFYTPVECGVILHIDPSTDPSWRRVYPLPTNTTELVAMRVKGQISDYLYKKYLKQFDMQKRQDSPCKICGSQVHLDKQENDAMLPARSSGRED